MMSSPLKRYTPSTVEDWSGKPWHYKSTLPRIHFVEWDRDRNPITARDPSGDLLSAGIGAVLRTVSRAEDLRHFSDASRHRHQRTPGQYLNDRGVLPSYVGGISGFRKQIGAHRLSLFRSCLRASWARHGLHASARWFSSTFRSVVPWLIGRGLYFSPPHPGDKHLEHIEHTHPSRRRALFVGVFAVSVYGGYFGAGLESCCSP